MLRRPRGEAAQKILDAFEQMSARELSIHELQGTTLLPTPTLRDNVKLLAKQGRLVVRRDDDSLMWISLPD